MTDPLAPPAAASAPVDPFEALCVLADTAAQASTQLFDYRRTHPGAPDLAQALNLEMTLDRRAIELRTQAVTLLGECAAEAVAQLRAPPYSAHTRQVARWLPRVDQRRKITIPTITSSATRRPGFIGCAPRRHAS